MYPEMEYTSIDEGDTKDSINIPGLDDKYYWGLVNYLRFSKSLDKYQTALMCFGKNSTFKLPHSSNSYLGLGQMSYDLHFKSWVNMYSYKCRHIRYSLDQSSWIGYPLDFSNKRVLVETLQEDVDYRRINVQYFGSIVSCTKSPSPIKVLGHINLLDYKYNSFDFKLYSPIVLIISSQPGVDLHELGLEDIVNSDDKLYKDVKTSAPKLDLSFSRKIREYTKLNEAR